MQITLEELHGYLESKIHDDSASDEEYGLYIDVRDYGYEAFKFAVHKRLARNLINEIKSIMEE